MSRITPSIQRGPSRKKSFLKTGRHRYFRSGFKRSALTVVAVWMAVRLDLFKRRNDFINPSSKIIVFYTFESRPNLISKISTVELANGVDDVKPYETFSWEDTQNEYQRQEHARLARRYGIDAFCYEFSWNESRRSKLNRQSGKRIQNMPYLFSLDVSDTSEASSKIEDMFNILVGHFHEKMYLLHNGQPVLVLLDKLDHVSHHVAEFMAMGDRLVAQNGHHSILYLHGTYSMVGSERTIRYPIKKVLLCFVAFHFLCTDAVIYF